MRFDPALIFSQAFRPLFPLAAASSAVSVCVWLLGLAGVVPLPPHPTLWHAHEMLYGFATAVVLGFVLTAVENWTGRKAISSRTLMLLVGLWLCARVLGLIPLAQAHWLSAGFDVPVLFIGVLCMGLCLIRTGNTRNMIFIPFLFGLGLINLAFHVCLWGGHEAWARSLLHGTAWLLGFLMVFMGGRVIPFFSGRRLGYQPRQFAALNWLSTLSALALAIVVMLNVDIALPGLALVAGLASALRCLLWSPWRSWREPMLWILHLGYAWLIVAIGLLAGIEAGWLLWPKTAPIHALLVGALGCLGLGMISRVSLGHSGRPIRADGWITASFVMVVLAGVLRMSVYFAYADGAWGRMVLSALLWAAAFAIFAIRYVPWLWMNDVQHSRVTA